MDKSGIIAVIGRPNAGKSSLINALTGEKVAIVSPKPQTTRNRISGILNLRRGEDTVQIVFTDTPGIFKSRSLLDENMARTVRLATEGVDAIIYVVDGAKPSDRRDHELIAKYAAKRVPLIVAVNKIDAAGYELIYPKLSELSALKGVAEIMPVSALKKTNLDKLLDVLLPLIPEGPLLYDEDDYTDKPLRFMAAETVREKALLYLSDEIPHGIGVDISKYEERPDGLTDIFADIVCEKDSHKQIIIGDGGGMLKKIGIAARVDLERLTGTQVNLKLFVKVRENWRDNKNFADSFSDKI